VKAVSQLFTVIYFM